MNSANQNKLCLVTGALGHLGQALSECLLEEGYHVVGIGSGNTLNENFKKSEFLKYVSGKKTWTFYSVNLTSEEEVTQLFQSVSQNNNSLLALVNLVGGIYPWSMLHEVEAKTWDAMIELNLKTTFLCSREAIKIMIPQRCGKIINIGALAGIRGNTMAGPYGAAKAALINMTETMAEENKRNNIQVNAVVPGIIDTPTNRQSMPDADFSTWVKPQSIAEVISFLVSEKSNALTGSVLRVTGKL
ncbi:MAG TPA: SDR family NAD(P)-dependent oxidoreductase [bacterium]|nr:SDR family NAD(P)-dependent oxidoreductase [bacterium]HNC49668.1 SDR family NAD(P)-dependent oxidoreductase [bacterium]HNO90711.1 SDR family NAD(P)-dependent oxidoreductase [bacterium]